MLEPFPGAEGIERSPGFRAPTQQTEATRTSAQPCAMVPEDPSGVREERLLPPPLLCRESTLEFLAKVSLELEVASTSHGTSGTLWHMSCIMQGGLSLIGGHGDTIEQWRPCFGPLFRVNRNPYNGSYRQVVQGTVAKINISYHIRARGPAWQETGTPI